MVVWGMTRWITLVSFWLPGRLPEVAKTSSSASSLYFFFTMFLGTTTVLARPILTADIGSLQCELSRVILIAKEVPGVAWLVASMALLVKELDLRKAMNPLSLKERSYS